MEKIEGEKVVIEQHNQLLQERLSQMEAENNRLSKQVAQLAAQVDVSRGNTPAASNPQSGNSPTLTATLFKQEGEDDGQVEQIPFPTPSHTTQHSPTLEPYSLAEPSDMTRHPAAVLCDLQCLSEGSKEMEDPYLYMTLASNQNLNVMVLMVLQLLMTMTSAAYLTVIHPLSKILYSLRTGSALTFSTEEIYQRFPLILWLISTQNLSPMKKNTSPTSVFRMRLLARLLACSPALARPLRDATALQLAVSERSSRDMSELARGENQPKWESLLTLVWAIDCLERRRNRENDMKSMRGERRNGNGYNYGHGNSRSSWSSDDGDTFTSMMLGKYC